ncbi:hypothetical protein [Candidatus Viridilinea mediisalina]|uniref:hypothetical protein n=1 Tax=Candidatus Viridilinea mediisalina TaxID=2024553 RepID=UPI0013FD41C2|nr:hypothetical protein [Candidatus Viridilinea mediisalina]
MGDEASPVPPPKGRIPITLEDAALSRTPTPIETPCSAIYNLQSTIYNLQSTIYNLQS